MDNQNDVALVNTVNERGGIRVGEANAGAFVGSTLIAGKEFDIGQLINNITISDNFANTSSEGANARRILIVNLSDNSETVLYRDEVQTKIPAQRIEWYSYDNVNNQSIVYCNEGNTELRCLLQYIRNGSTIDTYYFDTICGNGDNMFEVYDYEVPMIDNVVCIVMNA